MQFLFVNKTKYFGLSIVLVCFVIVTMIITIINGFIYFGGDEPRYFYYSISFIKGEFLTLSLDSWREFLSDWGIPYAEPTHTIPKNGFAMNELKAIGGIVPSILTSPALYLGGMVGARVFSFFIGLIGIGFLVVNLERYFPRWIVISSVLATLLSVPFLAHLLILNLDIYLFTFVSIALYFLFEPKEERLSIYILPLIICCIPLMHTRASFVSGWLMLAYYYRIWRIGSKEKYLKVFLVSCLGFVFFVLIQWYMYGTLQNLRSISFKVDTFTVPTRIILEWFSVRHGLYVNAPMTFIGVIGLIYGSIRKNGPSFVGLIAFLIYSSTIIIQDASESFPARLWLMIFPFFTLGVCHFMEKTSESNFFKQPAWLLFAAALLVNIGIVSILLVDVNFFMLNRVSSFTFDWLFHKVALFHLGVFLPVKFPSDPINLSSENIFRVWVMAGLFAFFLIGWMLSISTLRKSKFLGTVFSLASLFIMFDLCRVSGLKLDPKSCLGEVNRDNQKQSKIVLDKDLQVAGIRLLNLPYYEIAAYSSDYPKYIKWEVVNDEGRKSQGISRFFPIIFPSSFGKVSELTLTELSPTKADWNKECYEILVDHSMVRSWVRIFEY